jgi:hypothetical protein
MQGVSLCGDLVISIAITIVITSPTPIASNPLGQTRGLILAFFSACFIREAAESSPLFCQAASPLHMDIRHLA